MTRMSRFSAVVLFFLAFSIAAANVSAQIAAGGAIQGYVKGRAGRRPAGATLTATTPASSLSFTAVTDTNGFYRLLNLPPGVYAVVSELSGFSKFERTGLDVRAGLDIQVDLMMKVGSLSETVEVSGATPMLEVKKTVQAVDISGLFQRSLPLSGRREWSDVLALTPGVMSRSTDQFGGDVYFLRGTDNENHVIRSTAAMSDRSSRIGRAFSPASAPKRSATPKSRRRVSMPPRRWLKAWSPTLRRPRAPIS